MTRPNISVTSRLYLVLNFKIMLQGFSTKNLHKFVKSTLDQKSKSCRSLLQKFEANPQLESICTHPINAAIITFLADDIGEGDVPITQTEMYRTLVSHLLNKYVSATSVGNQSIKNFEHLPLYVKNPFMKLCKLAYKTKKYMFTVEELNEANVEFDNSFGLLQIQSTSTMYETKPCYSFLHLSVQEFLAAVHVSLKQSKDQPKCIKQLLDTNYALAFYAGLTSLSNPEVLNLLLKILRHPLDDFSVLNASQTNPIESKDPRRRILSLFNCLYECQNKYLFQLPEMQLPQVQIIVDKAAQDKMKTHALSFIGLGLIPADCIAIGYFLRMYTLSVREKSSIWFQMGISSDAGMVAFMKEVRRGVNIRTPTRITVRFAICALGKASLLALRELLTGQSNIGYIFIVQVLYLALIPIALKSIAEGLADDSSCHFVNLSHIGIKSIHVHYLILMLLCSSLKCLIITDSDLQQAMGLLSAALQFSMIEQLYLIDCGIDNTGLFLLGNAICVNKHIKAISIIDKLITLDGVWRLLCYTSAPLHDIQIVINNDVYQALIKKLTDMYPELETDLPLQHCLPWNKKPGATKFVVVPAHSACQYKAAARPLVKRDILSLLS